MEAESDPDGESHDPHGLRERAAFLLGLREAGIRDLAVLRALETVSRRDFVSPTFAPLANRNMALPIDHGQSCPAPLTAARILVAAQLGPNLRLLEIGSGCGFFASLVAQMVRDVVAVERHSELVLTLRSRLQALAIANVASLFASEWTGRDTFDRVVISGVLPSLPERVWTWLRDDGLVVYARSGAPSNVNASLVAARRDTKGQITERAFGAIRLPAGRLLPGDFGS